MKVEFRDAKLARLEHEVQFTAGYDQTVVRGFRKLVQLIRAAHDERDLYAWKSLHFEKLKGDRAHQRSMRINAQWRLILEILSAPDGNTIVVIKIDDYH